MVRDFEDEVDALADDTALDELHVPEVRERLRGLCQAAYREGVIDALYHPRHQMDAAERRSLLLFLLGEDAPQ